MRATIISNGSNPSYSTSVKLPIILSLFLVTCSQVISASSAADGNDGEREPLNPSRTTVNGERYQSASLESVIVVKDLSTVLRDAESYKTTGFKLPVREPREDVPITLEDTRLEEIEVDAVQEEINKVLACLQYLTNEPTSAIHRVMKKNLAGEFGQDPNNDLNGFQAFLIRRALAAAQNEGALQNYLNGLKDKIDDLQEVTRQLLGRMREDNTSVSRQFETDKSEFTKLLTRFNSHLEEEQRLKEQIRLRAESKWFFQKPRFWLWAALTGSAAANVGLGIWIYFLRK